MPICPFPGANKPLAIGHAQAAETTRGTVSQ